MMENNKLYLFIYNNKLYFPIRARYFKKQQCRNLELDQEYSGYPEYTRKIENKLVDWI